MVLNVDPLVPTDPRGTILLTSAKWSATFWPTLAHEVLALSTTSIKFRLNHNRVSIFILGISGEGGKDLDQTSNVENGGQVPFFISPPKPGERIGGRTPRWPKPVEG